MSSVEELRRKFATGAVAGGTGAAAVPGGRPAPPRKPSNGNKRPVSVIGSSGNNSHNGSGIAGSTWNSNNTSASSSSISSYHNNRGSQQQQDDIYDNEPHDNGGSTITTTTTTTKPSYPPPLPTSRQLPPPQPRSDRSQSTSTPSWTKAPPVPHTARPESHVINDSPKRASPLIPNARPFAAAAAANSADNTTAVEFTSAGKGVSYELCTDLLQNYSENVAAHAVSI